jgi:hypothetical protein
MLPKTIVPEEFCALSFFRLGRSQDSDFFHAENLPFGFAVLGTFGLSQSRLLNSFSRAFILGIFVRGNETQTEHNPTRTGFAGHILGAIIGGN